MPRTAACEGIAEDDRDRSPFTRTSDIANAELLDPGAPTDESSIPIVRVTFATVPGLSVQSMQRLVDCHLARNAALGHDIPEMETCPLVPSGVAASVAASDGDVVVTVFAGQANANEVRTRAEKLASGLKERRPGASFAALPAAE